MLDFRKSFLALAGLTLLVGSAFAQTVNPPLSCTAQSAGTPSIRAEGVTELVGDVLISCTGGNPSGAGEILRQVNFQVFTQPSINITSRQLAGGGTGNFSEALLFIDEPGAASGGDTNQSQQTICGSSAYPYSVPPGSGQTLITGVCGAHVGADVVFSAGVVVQGRGLRTYDPDVAGGAALVACVAGSSIPNGYGGSVTCPSTGVAAINVSRGNTYQARQTGANTLIWQGVPFDPPGTLTTRQIRITNVRVNASQLGVPAGSQAAVQLLISTSASGVTNPIAVPITNPTPTVAIAQPSLSFSVVDALTCLQCESTNKDFSANSGSGLSFGNCYDSDGAPGQVQLRWTEIGFPSAFRRRNDSLNPTPIRQDRLGVIYQTESGFMRTTTNGSRWETTAANGSLIASTASGTLGLADHATRVMARFSNVQNGIQIWTTAFGRVRSNQAGSSTPTTLITGQAVLVTTDPNGAGPYSPTAALVDSDHPVDIRSGYPAGFGGLAQVSVVGGAGQVVYEIVLTDTTAFERVEVPVIVAWTANTSANLPSLGTSSVNGNYAPISTTATASSTAPIPRFVDTAANRNFLTINSCRSNILFPFVSNNIGLDTGLAIANTSKDPFGTALQTGACTVNFYGTIGTSKVCLAYPSPSITGGEHFAWSLMSGGAVQATAGFQGYVIAQCQFQYGHGFAFISKVGLGDLAMGYLALVMDDSIGSRTGSKSETLGH